MRRFTDIAILTDVGRIITSQLTSQRLYTLLRPISHVALSRRHLSHSPNLRFHIYHYSLVRFACLSAKDCRTPRTVTLRSLQSRRSHTRRTAFGFLGFVVVHCTDRAIVSVSPRMSLCPARVWFRDSANVSPSSAGIPKRKCLFPKKETNAPVTKMKFSRGTER